MSTGTRRRASGALRVVEYDLMVYARTWRGTVMVSIISPILFLSAMGLGLGGLVGRGSGTVAGTDYVRFLAPGLLAGAAMNTALIETTYPIMGKIHWQKYYDAMLSTPLRVVDLIGGEVTWIVSRLVTLAVINLAVMALFGVLRSPEALLVIPFATATGLAFGGPILAYTATQSRDTGFSALNRFVVLPLFLLSGPFFPITQLPVVLQGIAWCFPLAHGVALTRGAVLGDLGVAAALGHVAVLCVYAAAGLIAARITLTRRLVR
jgi:lipooligosaccharide transport system permease protein